LLLSAWRAGDIGRLLPGAGRAVVPQQQGAAAANAGSVTLTADVRLVHAYVCELS